MTTIQDASTRTVSGAPSMPVHITNNTLPTSTPPTGTSAMQVQGTAADGATPVGNPVLVGLLDGSGNVQALFGGVSGAPVVQLGRATDGILNSFLTPGDGTGSQNCNCFLSFGMLFNGTSYDRMRGNHERQVYASAARTSTPAATDQTNYNAQSVWITIDVTAVTSTPSVVPTVEVKSTEGTDYIVIATGVTITTTGVYTIVISPTPAAGTVVNRVNVNDIVTRLWRLNMTHGDADSITYSVSANYI